MQQSTKPLLVDVCAGCAGLWLVNAMLCIVGSQSLDRLLGHDFLDCLQCTATSTQPTHSNGKSGGHRGVEAQAVLQARLSNSERAAGDAAAEAGATAANLQCDLEEQKQESCQLHKQLQVDDQQISLASSVPGCFPRLCYLAARFSTDAGPSDIICISLSSSSICLSVFSTCPRRSCVWFKSKS